MCVCGWPGSLSDVIECLATFRDIRGISQCLEATVQYSAQKIGANFLLLLHTHHTDGE